MKIPKSNLVLFWSQTLQYKIWVRSKPIVFGPFLDLAHFSIVSHTKWSITSHTLCKYFRYFLGDTCPNQLKNWCLLRNVSRVSFVWCLVSLVSGVSCVWCLLCPMCLVSLVPIMSNCNWYLANPPDSWSWPVTSSSLPGPSRGYRTTSSPSTRRGASPPTWRGRPSPRTTSRSPWPEWSAARALFAIQF